MNKSLLCLLGFSILLVHARPQYGESGGAAETQPSAPVASAPESQPSAPAEVQPSAAKYGDDSVAVPASAPASSPAVAPTPVQPHRDTIHRGEKGGFSRILMGADEDIELPQLPTHRTQNAGEGEIIGEGKLITAKKALYEGTAYQNTDSELNPL